MLAELPTKSTMGGGLRAGELVSGASSEVCEAPGAGADEALELCLQLAVYDAREGAPATFMPSPLPPPSKLTPPPHASFPRPPHAAAAIERLVRRGHGRRSLCGGREAARRRCRGRRREVEAEITRATTSSTTLRLVWVPSASY